jgi:molybdate transport system substrate-binding protein
MRRALIVGVLAALGCVLLAGACDRNNGQQAGAVKRTKVLRVFAASSLSEVFKDIAKIFESERPDTRVELNFGASSALAQQVIAGAPVDIVATADEATMKRLVDARQIGSTPKVIARNELVMLVEKGNPKAIAGLADLAKPGVVFAMCAPEVPCGRLGAAALRNRDREARHPRGERQGRRCQGHPWRGRRGNRVRERCERRGRASRLGCDRGQR